MRMCIGMCVFELQLKVFTETTNQLDCTHKTYTGCNYGVDMLLPYSFILIYFISHIAYSGIESDFIFI